jgi:hypothetical protein
LFASMSLAMRGNIVELLNSVLKWPAFEIDTPKLDFWKWKYIDVPGGPATIGLVVNENGIVCHSAGLPLRIIIGGKEFKSHETSSLFFYFRSPHLPSELPEVPNDKDPNGRSHDLILTIVGTL